MREQIRILVELQRIETEAAALRNHLAAVGGRIAALDERLKGLEEAVSAKEAVFKEQKKKYRSQESEVQAILAAIRASQNKLGAVKNNKEYQALLKEIDERRAKSSALEDEMLEFLEHMEQTESDIAAERSLCREEAAGIALEKAEILQKADARSRLLQKLGAEREETMRRLDPALLKRFLQVRAVQSDGLAVASVSHAVCSGCNVNIPPQMFNELQKCDSIRLCPSCMRIIYWMEA